MNRLLVLAAALGTSIGLSALPATAASCPLAVDREGDGLPQALQYMDLASQFANSPSLDLLSLDFATGRRTAVLALRVLDVNAFEPLSPNYAEYAGMFRAGTETFVVALTRDNGLEYVSFYRNRQFVPSDGIVATVDPATSTITWTIPRALIEPLDSRATFDRFAASSIAKLGVKTNADALSGDAVYVDRTRSCIAAE